MMDSAEARPKRKRRVISRKKRTLDPSIPIDYKYPDILKRFVTDRGKIIPRRISGATSKQQRMICTAIKRARYLGLLHLAVSHRPEKGFSGEMGSFVMGGGYGRDFNRPRYDNRGPAEQHNRPAEGFGGGNANAAAEEEE